MEQTFVEATQGFNWGKFMVARFDAADTSIASSVAGGSLLARCGWVGDEVLVVDLQTGEGAMFRPGGRAGADLERHRVHVCPLFEPFLAWLYQWCAGGNDPLRVPPLVELAPGDAPAALYGYRRPGPDR